MELTFTCPDCQTVGRAAIVPLGSIACGHCGATRDVKAGTEAEGALVACPWCATSDMYLQKDFPQGLGLLILVIGFAISTVFWYFHMPLWTFAVLIASVALDWWLYYHVGDVTVCYRCLSQVRGAGASGAGRFKPFDLAIGERYRQERIRIEELKQEQSRAGSRPAG